MDERQTRPYAVGAERSQVFAVDLHVRPPACGGCSAHAHDGRTDRQIFHLRLILPDEAAQQFKVAVHSVIQRIVAPLREALLAEEGARVGGLDAEAEHPGTEPFAAAVPHWRRLSD